MKITLINDDSAAALKTLPDNSIDCVVSSPPYGDLRDYNGHNLWDFKGTARELYRVIKKGGVVCWNVNDEVDEKGSESGESFREALYFMEIGFNLHDTMIYKKKNFSHPEKARYHQMFEYVFILSKGRPKVFNPIKDKKNKTAGCIGTLGTNTYTERDGSKSVRPKKITAEYGMRGNVWEGKTRGQEEFCKPCKHPAMMPKWLARDLIISWSNEGDIVCDPFSGSGTTVEEGRKLNRSLISIDIDPHWIIEQESALKLNVQINSWLYGVKVIMNNAAEAHE